MGDERLVRLARELESRDAELAAAITDVEELRRAVAQVLERAGAVAELLGRLPDERQRLAAAVREVEAELGRRRLALVEAEAELARAQGSGDDERLAAARRAHVRTRDAVSSAARKLERAVGARSALEREAAGAAREAPELEQRARELAGGLARRPRISRGATAVPDSGLAGVIDWADRARAALFVVRGQLDTERERVVREANELAAGALGDPAAATSVALVRERLERA